MNWTCSFLPPSIEIPRVSFPNFSKAFLSIRLRVLKLVVVHFWKGICLCVNTFLINFVGVYISSPFTYVFFVVLGKLEKICIYLCLRGKFFTYISSIFIFAYILILKISFLRFLSTLKRCLGTIRSKVFRYFYKK